METVENKRFVYEFGKFLLDPRGKALFADGKSVRLPAKEFQTLLLLVESRGRALSKEEMIEAIWPGAFVEEANLAKQISRLRKILNSNGENFIETLPRHGYRFLVDVNRMPESYAETILQERKTDRLTVSVDEELLERESTDRQRLLPPSKRRLFTRGRLIGGLVVLFAAAGLWVWWANTREINSVAVLPLRSLTDEENGPALGLGLTDALIARIGAPGQIVVRPIGVTASYTDTTQDALEIGRKLKVDAILEGAVDQSGGRTRISVRLLKVKGGEEIWAEEFHGETARIFDLQDRLTRSTADALKLKLGPSEIERLAQHHPFDIEAFNAYLKGRYFWNRRTEQGLNKAIGFFHQAIEHEPHYAPAYSGLADCYLLLGIWGAMPPMAAMPKAKDAAVKALQEDDTLADAHTSLAFVKWVYDWDWKGADEEFQVALRSNPNYSTAHHWRSYYLATMGRFDEAVSHIDRAREIEGSLSLSINTDIGEIYCWAREYDKAVVHLQEVVRTAPDFAAARNALGIAYLKQGRIDEAVAELEAARRLDNNPRMMSTLGHAYGVSGRREKARAIIAELKKLSRERYVSSFSIAVVHAGLGEDEEAVSRLEEAFAERSDTMAILGVYPLLDNLRANAHFIRLQQRVGFSM